MVRDLISESDTPEAIRLSIACSLVVPSGNRELMAPSKTIAKSATSFAIPNSVKKIDKEAFYGCNRLTSITIPNSITRIEDATFYDTGITSIEIPNSVTYIGEHAFSQTKLTSVKLPESVASLGDNVFANNDDLARIELNGKITKIPINAFYQCEALTTIVWGTNSNVMFEQPQSDVKLNIFTRLVSIIPY